MSSYQDALQWLRSQGYWITEIETGGVREFELRISPANKRFKSEAQLTTFAKSKRWKPNPQDQTE